MYKALQPHQSKKKNEDRVPLVMTYDPSHSSISSTIQKYLPILHSSRRCKDAIPKPPMVAFLRPINIKDMVVRSSIRVPSAEPPGFNPCKTVLPANTPTIPQWLSILRPVILSPAILVDSNSPLSTISTASLPTWCI